jgi:hypothetical protein
MWTDSSFFYTAYIGLAASAFEDVLLPMILEWSPPVYREFNKWNGARYIFLS